MDAVGKVDEPMKRVSYLRACAALVGLSIPELIRQVEKGKLEGKSIEDLAREISRIRNA